ncbi:pre-mRNA processing RNA-helicase [Cladochytrium tenue]|nr:pre-mRNA processing RNA-helicase [Cladochytrium tenue]
MADMAVDVDAGGGERRRTNRDRSHRDHDRDSERPRDRGDRGDRDKDRDKERDHERDRHRDRRDREDRDRNREKDHEKSRDKHREKDRDRHRRDKSDRDRDRDRDREKGREHRSRRRDSARDGEDRDDGERRRRRDEEKDRRSHRDTGDAIQDATPEQNGELEHAQSDAMDADDGSLHSVEMEVSKPDEGQIDLAIDQEQRDGESNPRGTPSVIEPTSQQDEAGSEREKSVEPARFKPNEAVVASVMDSLSVEEKTRQRRERVEKWRKERLAKEQGAGVTNDAITSLTGNQSSSITAEVDTTENAPQRKNWSLEDDDDDEQDSALYTKDSGSTLIAPSSGLSSEKEFPSVLQKSEKTEAPKRKPLPRVTAVKSKQNPFASSFGVINKARPTALFTTFSEVDADDAAEDASLAARKRMRISRISGLSEATESSENTKKVEETDALDVFMADVKTEVDKLREEDKALAEIGRASITSAAAVVEQGRIEEEEVVGDARARGSDEGESDSDEDILGEAAKKLAAKRKDLAKTDHSVMNYEPFRKNFYIEPPELTGLTEAEVEIRRADLGGIKIRGVNCPKPIEKWAQMGLPPGCADIITKTLAFLLPMFRHIKDQRPLALMEGPIALIMTPTRELAVQIHRECKPFMKILNIRAVCAYGGAPIKDQIADGRVTNLKRVTYLVLDEADRMFDMGFEPQIVEVREDDTKFLRLLEILGLCMAQDPDTKVLIFVDTHEAADNLLRDLLHRSYPCQSVHGGKDQADRDSTIADFKSGVINVVIATSVAARGLDVKNLKIVINYECPNHMEDYVHRCGRTGRAGNKGTAYTFITPEQDKYAIDIVQALKMSNAEVPEPLNQLAESFIQKVKEGKASYSSSGFGGKGLDRLDKDRDMVKKIQKKSIGNDYADEDEDAFTSDDEESGFKKTIVRQPQNNAAAAKEKEKAIETAALAAAEQMAAAAAASGASADDIEKLKSRLAEVNAKVGKEGQRTAAQVIEQLNRLKTTSVAKKNASDSPFAMEVEINDFPQRARWKVTNKEQISQITEMCGAAITTRGNFVAPGKQPGPGERKLFLFIEGETEISVNRAVKEIKRILKEATAMAIESESTGSFGRYLVTNG